MLVSSTEPEALRGIDGASISTAPEAFGVDFLIATVHHGMVGIQRKELKDFVASSRDGRLVKELAQMKRLSLGVVLLEGREQWTNDGSALWSSDWTRAQHLGAVWRIQSHGYWLASTSNLTDTAEWLSTFRKWLQKERHSSLTQRPSAKASSPWGTSENEDFCLYLLQSIDGVGPKQAKAIYDKFGVPIQWTISELDLQTIPGIGQRKAERIIQSLSQGPSTTLSIGSGI